MYRIEDDHWWYVGLRDLLVGPLREAAGGDGPGPAILDAGCGTGRTLADLADRRAFGLEFAAEAFRFLRSRGVDRVARGSVCRLPFADGAFDAVVSADVLCCVGAPGDLEALREFRRVLRPGGVLLLNLPAYPWLMGRHDAAVHTKRRYTRPVLRALLESAGLTVRACSYRNTLLFPVAAAVRLAQRLAPAGRGGPARSDLSRPSGPVNRLLTLPLLLENRLVRAGAVLPFGLSVYARATRP
ncbi:MAG: class I SAM-dependent methyltransferase [Thermoleophilia bacterium]|nr:class I SAM-dependent methyltransferase [Thermoleophilia bacterium]